VLVKIVQIDTEGLHQGDEKVPWKELSAMDVITQLRVITSSFPGKDLISRNAKQM